MSGDVHARFCESRGVRSPPATHLVAVFEDQEDAARFRVAVAERLERFGLQVAPAKTAIRRFDRTPRAGNAKPRERAEPFTFLGFTHFLTPMRRGWWKVDRTPSVRSRERFLHRIAGWLRVNRHRPVRQQQAYLWRALAGYYQYFGLRLCSTKLSGVRERVVWLWKRTLARRSQRARRRTDWATLHAAPWFQLPPPRLTHRWV